MFDRVIADLEHEGNEALLRETSAYLQRAGAKRGDFE
jgi:hypothetical protein